MNNNNNNLKNEFASKMGTKLYSEEALINNGSTSSNIEQSNKSSTNSKKRNISSIFNENEVEKPFKKSMFSSSASSSSSSSVPPISSATSSATSTSSTPAANQYVPVSEKEQSLPENATEKASSVSSLSDYVNCNDHKVYVETCNRCQALEKLSRELAKDRIILEKVIGIGGFGTVYKGSLNNQWVAIKIFKEANDDYENEIKYLQMLKGHQNVIEYKFSKKYGNMGVIVFELMDQSLHGFIEENQEFFRNIDNREKLVSIVKDIALGLEALHENNIVHVDFHPGNVLLDKDNFRAKITDFGLSKMEDKEDQVKGRCATAYRPPEARGKKKSRADHKKYSDIYQFGLMLFHLILHKVEGQDTFAEIPSVYKDLTLRCLNPKPAKRPTIKEIITMVNKW